MRRYIKVWYLLTINSFSIALMSRFGAALFLIGKILRFVFFLTFLVVLVGRTKALAGYSLDEVIFFFLVFNLIDTLTQLLFREVYRFRVKVVHGNFDLDLLKPICPLFKALAGGADLLDLFMLIPYSLLLIFIITKLSFSAFGVFALIALFINAIIIAVSFHILVLALGILTTEVNHAIMIYRDLTNMGRLPIDIYKQPLRSILTFIIPVGVMMTFPAKALLGMLSKEVISISILLALAFYWFSLKVWNYSLSKYSSASS